MSSSSAVKTGVAKLIRFSANQYFKLTQNLKSFNFQQRTIQVDIPHPIDAFFRGIQDFKYTQLNTSVSVFLPSGFNIQRPQGYPLIIHLHGGGFIFGSSVMDASICRLVADKVDAVCISVDYLKAPEHPFPWAPEQLFGLFRWLVDPEKGVKEYNIDSSKIGIFGYSAGGNLTESLCIIAHDRQHLFNQAAKILVSIPIYPVINLNDDYKKRLASFPKDSPISNKSISPFVANFFDTSYIPRGSLKNGEAWTRHPYLSPFFGSKEQLSFVKNKVVLTGEYDLLHINGDLYANELKAAGCNVTHRCFARAIHGWNFARKDSVDYNEEAIIGTNEILLNSLHLAFTGTSSNA